MTDTEALAGKAQPKPKPKPPSVLEDLLFLLLKALIFAGMLAALFFLVLGIHRCRDDSMSPAFKNGDLVFYYRLQKTYQALDAVVVETDSGQQVRRIVAVPGDEVDITDEGLKINGYFQQEAGIYTETLPYTEGITFPITLEEDEYFVLADMRTGAEDSRAYGAVKRGQIKGLVMTLLRRRGL